MSNYRTELHRDIEAPRLRRLHQNDDRTAISDEQVRSLERQLRRSIEGEVRFDRGSRAIYATDGSNYRQEPIGVVVPASRADVQATVRLAREHEAPILSRGGGTSLAGQCCNVAVVMDFSKYLHRVKLIDKQRRIGVVEPGCILDTLRNTAAKEAGLTYGPDPATHNHNTLGGMLGNNSCGSHGLLSKNHGLGVRTSDNTHELDIVLYDGTAMRVGATPPDELERIIRAGGRRGQIYSSLKSLVHRYGDVIRKHTPKLERRVSGYNLEDLLPEKGFNVARALVGSESTLVTILEASMLLVPAPKIRTVAMLGFEDIYTAAECGLEVLRYKPIACEGIDELLFDYVKKKGDERAALARLPQGSAFLLVEFGGESKADSDAQARRMMDGVKNLGRIAPVDTKLYDDPFEEELIWKVREGGLGSTAWVPGHPDTWPGWEDSAVPVEVTPRYLRELRALYHKYQYNPSVYGHIGQGCVHCRVGFDLYTADGIKRYRRFLDEAVDLVGKFGGVASGEHGDGQARGQFWPQMFGPDMMHAFTEFKRIWDPDGRMNPGKLINFWGRPYGVTDNLRLGTDYNPPQPQTFFAYQADQHSFARAALRCVGVGECRREEGGTMCPSYMVTREEKHCTRGRSRLLFEMLNGEIIKDGWRSDEVRDALDLCLSCKGCKGDCPVNVDMATYKAEFLSHYYRGRLRPRNAYAFGLLPLWSRYAAYAPSAVNLLTQTPVMSSIAKLTAGIHPNRSIPPYAPQTFQQWFRSRPPKNRQGQPVVLFPDTFNNYFHPDVAIAATEVLEDAGFLVQVPLAPVCCGRTLYDYGFLGTARRWCIDLLAKLRPYYRAGSPVIILEPSCWASVVDEMIELLPGSEDAKRLKALSFNLSDFLRANARNYSPPQLNLEALVHGHCHHKALDNKAQKVVGKLAAEKELFKNIGLEANYPSDGCCGMAGAFGFEKTNNHYQVGLAVGERVLLPAVRKAPDRKLIVADGFSCQEQIAQETGRLALHTAQALQMALRRQDRDSSALPEEPIVVERRSKEWRGMTRAAALLGLASIAAFEVIMSIRKGRIPTRERLINAYR